MPAKETIEGIRQKYVALSPVMDERMRRQWAASEASALGWGGVSSVAKATGLAWNTIKAGLRELAHRAAHPDEPVETHIRRRGAGRKRLTETDPQLLGALEALSIRPPGDIPNRRCAGPVRVRPSWPKR